MCKQTTSADNTIVILQTDTQAANVSCIKMTDMATSDAPSKAGVLVYMCIICLVVCYILFIPILLVFGCWLLALSTLARYVVCGHHFHQNMENLECLFPAGLRWASSSAHGKARDGMGSATTSSRHLSRQDAFLTLHCEEIATLLIV